MKLWLSDFWLKAGNWGKSVSFLSMSKCCLNFSWERFTFRVVYDGREKKDDDEKISRGENETEGRMRFHFTFPSSPASLEMQMVPLLSIQEYESLPLTNWNIRQPSLDLEQEDALYSGITDVTPFFYILYSYVRQTLAYLHFASRNSALTHAHTYTFSIWCLSGGLDLIVVPGLAFTESGHRLGSGKGYYDRYVAKLLSCCSPDRRPYLMGLAFSQQVLQELPVDEHDVILDQVITANCHWLSMISLIFACSGQFRDAEEK